MAFLIPRKMISSAANTTTTSIPIHSSSHEEGDKDDLDERPAGRAVTRQLYLKSESHRSLDKDVVLRRIRQRKRVNRIKSAFQSFIRVSPDPPPAESKDAADDPDALSWLVDDVFSFP
ncbi:hypothetical protein J5N97_028507 [Dioscorea zingiberensis]|uniref:Uncharacterized protein n=1 Tax=Dioscorea zingiberensis TaxID=325984 RepID=A0A9D5BZC5_9LILI|nr:hypothetical protein J5N97_028507 [Dioscorea zingiberensis]